jgi:hypothetical protein
VAHDAQLIAALTIRGERLDEVSEVDEADDVAVQAANLLRPYLDRGSVKVESIEELHCELPPGVDLLPGRGPIDADALRAIEEG